METALLVGGEGSSGDQRWDRMHSFNRTNAIAYGTTYQKAAALVDLAEDGTGIPEEILDNSSFASSLKSYLIFIRFDFLWSLNYFALVVLNFFEKPLWCSGYCNNRGYYFLGPLPYLTGAESLVYEVSMQVLILCSVFQLLLENVVLLLVLLIADLLVYIIYLSPVAFYTLPFRIAPYIRIVFFILNIRDLRDSIVILVGMLGTYLNILALWALFLLFSSWLAFVIFEDTQQGKTIFTSYGTTLYQMFLLFTTSNNPDVWIPAYKASRWYCLFFILYVLLSVNFVTNLILAAVYDGFKSELVKQVDEKDRTKMRILKKAFDLMDIRNLNYLDKDQIFLLLVELNNYRILPTIFRDDFESIFRELDGNHDFKIDLDEFADLCNTIALRFQKEDSVPVFESLSFYRSPASKRLKDFVKSSKFGYIIVFILVLNFVAVIIETMLDIQNNSAQEAWQKVEFVFGWLYVVEMALKVYAYGFENYWRDGQNRFDFIITWVIVVGETVTFVSPQGLTFLSNGEWIRYLLIARMLRLIRLLLHVQRYRAFVATFVTLILSLMPYLGIIFCVMCIYCSLGVQIFGGIVNAGNPNLEGTDLNDNECCFSIYYQFPGSFFLTNLSYLLFNFNDYPNGMVTLFNLLMGNWRVWMQSYRDLTGTTWSYAYFISFYLITIVLLLNLVVAFVLEAFFAEMDLETSEKYEDAIGKDESLDESQKEQRRRNMGMKVRRHSFDMLLRRMLSAELRKTECSSP
ncbi:two pore calcium channel 1B [Olea europaea subsp. europaea]|uniref:Two pore calcium channel 1B n=1 Tax=Olea europaea subsp. europaea TaxID=158383 RepID=A0A8S0S4R4_OLEEU|nr:two pore calcium channel 1B [Olea europaea subsp. europaea]